MLIALHRNLNTAFLIFSKATKHSYYDSYDRYTSSSVCQFRSQTLENKNYKYTGCKNQPTSMNQHFNFHLVNTFINDSICQQIYLNQNKFICRVLFQAISQMSTQNTRAFHIHFFSNLIFLFNFLLVFYSV